MTSLDRQLETRNYFQPFKKRSNVSNPLRAGAVEHGDEHPARAEAFVRQRRHDLLHLRRLGRPHHLHPSPHGGAVSFSSHPS